jgi:bifunctional non-homologous end joining protein LigD
VLDGEMAVPDDRGVTHIGHLQDALDGRQPDRLAYFAFDLLHLDGHDLRHCPIEDRKGLLRQVLDDVCCARLVYVDHVVGRGVELFEHVRAIGGEGIVSKRTGSLYTGKTTRDWRKTKCHATGQFVVTGFEELGPGRLEALHVAEERDGEFIGVGQVRFGFAGKGLWVILDRLRAGSMGRRTGVVPIEPGLVVQVKYFGRHKGGAIRDGVLLALVDQPQTAARAWWTCDTDAVIAAMDAVDAV